MAETRIRGQAIGDATVNHLDLEFITTPTMNPISTSTNFVVWDSINNLVKLSNLNVLVGYFNTKYPTNLLGITATVTNINSITGILGTNAFNSTSFLPLSGGTLTGNLNINNADTIFSAINVIKGNNVNTVNTVLVTTNSITPWNSITGSGSLLRIGHLNSTGNVDANIDNLINGGGGYGNLILQQGATGFVGLGISPTEKLHVSGNGLFTGNITSSPATLSNQVVIKSQLDEKLNSVGGTLFFNINGLVLNSNQTLTVSANGLQVTLSNIASYKQFEVNMVGAKLLINGVERIISVRNSTSLVTVSQAYPSSMFSQVYDFTKLVIYCKSYESLSNGTSAFYTGLQAGGAPAASLFINNQGGYVNTQYGYQIGTAAFYSNGCNNQSTAVHVWSNSNSNYSATKDLGLRRNSAGILEIFNGITTDGTITNRRDLLVRNVNASTLGINESPSIYGSVLHIKGHITNGTQNTVMVTNNGFIQGALGVGTGSTIRIGHGVNTGNTYGSIDNLIDGGNTYGNLILQRGGGFVGLGIDIPTQKLHVSGNGLFTGNVTTSPATLSNHVVIKSQLDTVISSIVTPTLQQVLYTDNTTTYPIIINEINENTGLTIGLIGDSNGIIISTNSSTIYGNPISILDEFSNSLFTVTHSGQVTATNFIGPLIGNASTATTATNLSGLTASITNLNSVTGILGTNAFNSTSFLPLAGGSLTGTLYSNDTISVSSDGVGHDPYGKIGIARPAHATNKYAYYGLTKAATIGWSIGIGIDGVNDFIIGQGATTVDKIITTTSLSLSTSGILTVNGLNLINETASTLSYFDSAKNVKSLSTTTYPSLTEISYVKGVTSSIQNQLNGKNNTLNGTGLVRMSGTTISYDNVAYLPLSGGTLTGALYGTSFYCSNFYGALNGNATTATNLTGLTATITNLNSVTGILGTNAFNSISYYPNSNPNGYTSNTGTLTGTGATNTLTKFTGANSIGISSITDTGTLVTISNPLTTGITTTPYINVGDVSGNGFRMNYPTGTFSQPWTALPATQNGSLQVAGANGGMLFRSLTNSNNGGLIFQSFIGTSGAVTTSPIKFQAFKSNGTTGIVDLSATDIAVQYTNLTSPLTTMLGNGNWGFGNISPSEKVHVTGFVLATGYKIPNGSGTEYLMADGSKTTSVASSTNLSITTTGTSLIVNSDTGTDATIPLASSTQAGIISNSSQDILGTKKLWSNDITGTFDTRAIELREAAKIGETNPTQTSSVYAPSITFHWAQNNQRQIALLANGDLVIRTDGGTGSKIWTAGNLTNLNQLTNGPGYITSSGTTDFSKNLTYNNSSLLTLTHGNFGGLLQDSTNGPEVNAWSNRIKMLHDNSSGYFTELAQNFTGTEGLWHRRASASTTPTSWKRVLDSSNFNTYSPTLTGTGASGTWNITSASATNLTGLTATIANLNLVTTANVGIWNGKQNALNGTGLVRMSGTTLSYDNIAYAPIASPSFNGVPTAPTALSGSSNTQIATTAFVTDIINTTDTSNVKLTGSQTILGIKTFSNNAIFSGTITANGGFFNSDERLKDIISRDGDLINFNWKDKRDTKTHIGYIAQEVQKTYPDAVQEDSNGMLSVNYIEVLVAKIQNLENRIKQLEN